MDVSPEPVDGGLVLKIVPARMVKTERRRRFQLSFRLLKDDKIEADEVRWVNLAEHVHDVVDCAGVHRVRPGAFDDDRAH